MKALDRLLQRWRIAKTRPFIAKGARVLDVGCSDGVLFRQLAERIGEGVGIDYELDAPLKTSNLELIPGTFPESLALREPFDVITMLAVLEHVPRERQPVIARGCAELLRPGGHLVITTPEPVVDHILEALKFLRLIDGMSLDEHYGFEPRETPAIFAGCGLRLVRRQKFQLGLNNLFVFRRESAPLSC
jgi:2-polyprenyl-3-methyl-5-hydroxy-6-metoxy-1,4-benzoquinol methylase